MAIGLDGFVSAIVKDVRIGDCRLILGDCLKVMPGLGKFDAVVTDPPYEFQTSGAGIFRSKRKNMDEIAAANLSDGFDYSAFCSTQFGSIVFFCHNDQLDRLIPYLSAQFSRYALLSWHKTNPMPVANRHYQPDTEFWIHAWNKGFSPIGELKDKKRFYFGRGGQDTTIDHPTVKPIALMEKVVGNVFGEILDPFMGSGTTLIACAKLGRKGTGIELDPDYFEIACRRVEEAYRQADMFTPAPENPVTPVQIDLLGEDAA